MTVTRNQKTFTHNQQPLRLNIYFIQTNISLCYVFSGLQSYGWIFDKFLKSSPKRWFYAYFSKRKKPRKRSVFKVFTGSWSPARTDDPAVNSRMLCQLSYSGIWPNFASCFYAPCTTWQLLLNSIFRVAFVAFALPTELLRNISTRLLFEQSGSSGNYLLSRAVTRQVSSTWRSLTSVFGMGTGGSPLLSSPDSLLEYNLLYPQN